MDNNHEADPNGIMTPYPPAPQITRCRSPDTYLSDISDSACSAQFQRRFLNEDHDMVESPPAFLMTDRGPPSVIYDRMQIGSSMSFGTTYSAAATECRTVKTAKTAKTNFTKYTAAATEMGTVRNTNYEDGEEYSAHLSVIVEENETGIEVDYGQLSFASRASGIKNETTKIDCDHVAADTLGQKTVIKSDPEIKESKTADEKISTENDSTKNLAAASEKNSTKAREATTDAICNAVDDATNTPKSSKTGSKKLCVRADIATGSQRSDSKSAIQLSSTPKKDDSQKSVCNTVDDATNTSKSSKTGSKKLCARADIATKGSMNSKEGSQRSTISKSAIQLSGIAKTDDSQKSKNARKDAFIQVNTVVDDATKVRKSPSTGSQTSTNSKISSSEKVEKAAQDAFTHFNANNQATKTSSNLNPVSEQPSNSASKKSKATNKDAFRHVNSVDDASKTGSKRSNTSKTSSKRFFNRTLSKLSHKMTSQPKLDNARVEKFGERKMDEANATCDKPSEQRVTSVASDAAQKESSKQQFESAKSLTNSCVNTDGGRPEDEFKMTYHEKGVKPCELKTVQDDAPALVDDGMPDNISATCNESVCEYGFEITDTKLSTRNVSGFMDVVALVAPSPVPPAFSENRTELDGVVSRGLEKIARKSAQVYDTGRGEGACDASKNSKGAKADKHAMVEKATKLDQVANEWGLRPDDTLEQGDTYTVGSSVTFLTEETDGLTDASDASSTINRYKVNTRSEPKKNAGGLFSRLFACGPTTYEQCEEEDLEFYNASHESAQQERIQRLIQDHDKSLVGEHIPNGEIGIPDASFEARRKAKTENDPVENNQDKTPQIRSSIIAKTTLYPGFEVTNDQGQDRVTANSRSNEINELVNGLDIGKKLGRREKKKPKEQHQPQKKEKEMTRPRRKNKKTILDRVQISY